MLTPSATTISLKMATLIAVLLGLVFFKVSAQVNFSNPTHITNQQGLPDNRVLCMAQDGKGFMWFGTYFGLCRFDGTEIKVFKHDPHDPASISSDLQYSLFFDDESNSLWIGTRKGLNVLDLGTRTFKKYFHDPDDPHSLPDNEISRTIFKDRQGDLWIGMARTGFVRYNRDKDNFERFAYLRSKADVGERTDKVDYVRLIGQSLQNDSILWLGTSSGLLRFNKYSLAFRRFYMEMGDKRTNILANSFRCMHLHSNGKIYLGAWGNFFHVFDPQAETFRTMAPTLDNERFPTGQGVAWAIMKKSGRELWVTTRHGLSTYDIDKGKITSELLNDPESQTIYSANFRDRSGRIWGISSRGVCIFDHLNQQFQHYPLEKNTRQRFYPMEAVVAPGQGKLFVNVAGGRGLYLLDRKTGSWTLIPPPSSFFESHSEFAGRGLLWLKDGRLLVVEERTLFTLSSDGKSLEPFSCSLEPGGARLMDVIQDQQGRLWLSSVNGGLFRLDLESCNSVNFQDELLMNDLKNVTFSVQAIFEDKHQNIWVDSYEGFSIYIPQKDTFINHRKLPGKDNVFKHVAAITDDLDGNVLIAGGKENGIGIADPAHPEKGILRKLAIKQETGFYFNAMMRDHSHNLWMDGEKKLVKVDLADLQSTQYDGYDGLAFGNGDPESVIIADISLLRTGEVVIAYGGGDGIGIFHPDSLRQIKEVPIPYLASFAVFDKELEGDTSLLHRKNITLPYSQNFFSFEFSALGFTHPHKIQFKYKLEGLDPDWIQPLEDRRYASYSNVGEGNYRLRIMAANGEGIWNEEEFNISIVVLPPWYRSWLAYFMYSIAIAILALAVYRFLKRRWALKMELEMEHREALRLKELNAFKTKVYTNITHEFRTPLTIIGGMAEQISENPKKWLTDGLDSIKRNTDHLLALVNQMLALRKIEMGSMPLCMVNGDVILYLKYLTESFHSLAETKELNLTFRSDTESLFMDYDPEKLRQIVSNLLSNAMKFTPKGGEVGLAVGMGGPSFEYFTLTVQDTGIGIPKEKLPYIFDRFFQVENNSALSTQKVDGTGIGLALTNELINLLRGKILVRSEVGEGTAFIVYLPVKNEANSMPQAFQGAVGKQGHFSMPPPADENSPAWDDREHAPSILLIEDHPDLLKYLSSCLEGYQLEAATNGNDGIQKAIDTVPDLIISDVMMPGKNGFEVCQSLKNDLRTSHVPIILLTAKADIDSRLEGLGHGADAYLTKPFHKKELLLRVEKLLELRRKLQAHFRLLATTGGQRMEALEKAQTKEHVFVRQVRELVEKHLDDPGFTVKQLAFEVAMSRSQLHRKMVALIGLSPIRFIRQIRLDKAKVLMRETEANVTEIAYQTGFSDPSYFSKMFTKEFGQSPINFRKEGI